MTVGIGVVLYRHFLIGICSSYVRGVTKTQVRIKFLRNHRFAFQITHLPGVVHTGYTIAPYYQEYSVTSYFQNT